MICHRTPGDVAHDVLNPGLGESNLTAGAGPTVGGGPLPL
jgi:hypothetical protein